MPTGLSAGNAARTASNTSSGKRMRFCKRAAILIGALVGDRRQELMQQIAVGAVHLDRVDAEPLGALGGGHKGLATRFSPAASNASGGVSPSLCGIADGPSARQPPSAIGINCPPSHGVWLEALRPAWASWIITAAFERLRTEARIGFSAASVASL